MLSPNPKISVIVPVYNTEKYLHRCIDSILAQTFTDFELLLIDDGSKDSSGAICDEYAAKDPRVRVFHKENGGVSSARNVGLDNMRGEWVTFCDSDDYTSRHYLINLLSATDNNEIDLVFNYATVHKLNKIEKESYPEKIVSLLEIHDLFSHNDLIWHTSTWSKLFKRSIIINNKHLHYEEGIHIGEDLVFLWSYMLSCRKIKVICTCDYHYIISNNKSLTRRINSFDEEYKAMDVVISIVDRVKAICPASPNIKLKFDWLVGSHKRRTLIALYHNDISRKARLEYLRNTDFSDYIAGCRENSIQGRFYKFSLKHHYYNLFDTIRMITVRIKG